MRRDTYGPRPRTPFEPSSKLRRLEAELAWSPTWPGWGFVGFAVLVVAARLLLERTGWSWLGLISAAALVACCVCGLARAVEMVGLARRFWRLRGEERRRWRASD